MFISSLFFFSKHYFVLEVTRMQEETDDEKSLQSLTITQVLELVNHDCGSLVFKKSTLKTIMLNFAPKSRNLGFCPSLLHKNACKRVEKVSNHVLYR